MRLIQCAFRSLQKGDAVLGIALSLVEAPDLILKFLADGQASSVICSLVDSQSARKLLDRAPVIGLRRREISL